MVPWFPVTVEWPDVSSGVLVKPLWSTWRVGSLDISVNRSLQGRSTCFRRVSKDKQGWVKTNAYLCRKLIDISMRFEFPSECVTCNSDRSERGPIVLHQRSHNFHTIFWIFARSLAQIDSRSFGPSMPTSNLLPQKSDQVTRNMWCFKCILAPNLLPFWLWRSGRTLCLEKILVNLWQDCVADNLK